MSDRTKVVVRHLPPTITEASLLPLIDSAFAGRYNWLSFRPAKIRSHIQQFCVFLSGLMLLNVYDAIQFTFMIIMI